MSNETLDDEVEVEEEEETEEERLKRGFWIEGRYHIWRNRYGWILDQYHWGTSEAGEPKWLAKGPRLYPGRLYYACTEILDQCGEKCSDAQEIKDAILAAKGGILKTIREVCL